MDMIAERLGMDPLELRRINLLRDGDTVMTGEPIHDTHFSELLDTAAGAIDWDFAGWGRDNGRTLVDGGRKARAKGLSCIIKGTITPSTSTAAARLNDDGSLHVLTSSVEMGQGLQTAMAILAAERMAVPLDRVSISSPDTDVTPYDQQTSSSRSTQAMGGGDLLGDRRDPRASCANWRRISWRSRSTISSSSMASCGRRTRRRAGSRMAT